MHEAMTPVILCGGGGTRLWPRSRLAQPKPFLQLVGERTLFEQALKRTGDSEVFKEPIVVSGLEHLELVKRQAAGRSVSVILEPSARNTAAAIALAALRLPEDRVMLVCPSDHHIADSTAFVEAARCGAILAHEGWLVAFGIRATAPETGFGYIKRGEVVAAKGLDGDAYRVDRFVEKPDREQAQTFLEEGGYDWNGGIFLFRARDFLTELRTFRPDIAQAVEQAVAEGRADEDGFAPDADLFAAVPSESIDYAVMEKTARAAVVPVDMGWSDIGNWQVLRDARPGDEFGNRVIGQAELVNCYNVLVESDGPRVSVIGLKDVCVVVDGNDVLVTSTSGAQKVGKLFGAQNQDTAG